MPAKQRKPQRGIERRVVPFATRPAAGARALELRAEQDQPPVIAGYPAVFNQMSDLLFGSFRERIAPGAFTETVQMDDIRALFNHNADKLLARRSPRHESLMLREDETGLYMAFAPPAVSYATDLTELVRTGLVDQGSFQFEVLDDTWDEVDKELIRTLVKVRLYDVSPVTFPAYPSTNVKVRAAIEAAGIPADPIERALIHQLRNVPIRPEDRAAVRSAIEVLSAIPALPATSDALTPAFDLAMARRRLQLVELPL